MKTPSHTGLFIIRIGLAFVFLWFGLSQLVSPDQWTAFVPAWATGMGITAHTLVLVNGIIEVVAGILLAFGLLVRPVGILLGIHLFIIATSLGLTAVGVRDFGLAIAIFGLGIGGSDEFGLGYLHQAE